jgi:Holliday junction DNA helicase RuvA
MIGRLQGRLLAKDEAQVMIDVSGVAYEVEVGAPTLFALPAIGQDLVLHTHFIVREDAQLLFGFLDVAERNFFRLLLKASGIGPKLALTILSGMEMGKLVAAILNSDLNSLVKIPGIGRKTAERMVLDLRDKVQQWQGQHGASLPHMTLAPSTKAPDSWQEAESALVTLGYKPQEAARVVGAAAASLQQQNKAVETSDLIRLALRMSL